MKKFNSLRNGLCAAIALLSLTMCHKKETNPSPNTGGTLKIAAVNCAMTIQPSQSYVDGKNIPAGSTVCLPSGTRGTLLLKNFVGTPTNPITFINSGGKVTFQVPTSNSYAIKMDNCQNIKILGNGDPSTKYGININGGNIGITLDHLSSDFEISNLEVQNCGFAGIMAKTDPSCDQATQRGNFVMQNVSIHDNYVHNTGGEGFYIGNSFFANGVNTSCGVAYPHEVWNAKVYNNITELTGCEGIQVGCATKGCQIYNNSISSPGQTPFASAQNNGLQIGEGTGGVCYNNIIKNAPGDGIVCLGLGDNVVSNNIIISSGSHGIFVDERYTPGPNFQFINNTIMTPGGNGMLLYSEIIPMNTIINNVIIKPGSGTYIGKRSGVKTTEFTNFTSMDYDSCKFKNASSCDFHLVYGSPLIDRGTDVSSYGVSSDYYSQRRPMGNGYDIGASEFLPPTPTTLMFTPTEDVYLEGTKVCNYQIVRATSSLRKTYMKFSVVGLNGSIPIAAKLRLRSDTYATPGTIKVSLGNSSTWTEGTINAYNQPTIVSTISTLTGSFVKSTFYEIDVSKAIKSDGTITLIIESSSDIAFSSSEKVNPPQLLVTKY